ncbi:armadillo-type protein [Scenedesmus sp. NREL 46B-D3]|nr:armadillo-type protein [Scenedesmus sp. NREL 46B-D3]
MSTPYVHRPKAAIVIGVSDYAKTKLPNAVRDAENMGRKLEDLAGFQVTRCFNPTQAQLAVSLSKFRKCLNGLAAANSIVVFYYAGHGLVVKGHHYMLCPDYEDYLQQDTDTACKVAGFSLNDALADITAAAQKAKVIALLDTCRSMRTRGGAPAAETQGSNLDVPLQDGTELLTCYACGHLKEANEGDDGGNGVYTKHLLQHLFDSRHATVLKAISAANACAASPASPRAAAAESNPTKAVQEMMLSELLQCIEPGKPAFLQWQAARELKLRSNDSATDKGAICSQPKVPCAKVNFMKESKAVSRVVGLLRDEEAGVRARAASLLAGICCNNSAAQNLIGKDARTISSLAFLLTDQQLDVRAEAARALASLASDHKDNSHQIVQELLQQAEMGDVAANLLCVLANSTHDNQTRIAKEPGVVPGLVALLRCPASVSKAKAPVAAAGALQRLAANHAENKVRIAGEPGAIKGLVGLLDAPLQQLRLTSCEALSVLANSSIDTTSKIAQEPGAISKLVSLLQNSDEDARCSAATTLGRLAAQHSSNQTQIGRVDGAVKGLVAMLRRDCSERAAAMEALKHLVDGNSVNMAVLRQQASAQHIRLGDSWRHLSGYAVFDQDEEDEVVWMGPACMPRVWMYC